MNKLNLNIYLLRQKYKRKIINISLDNLIAIYLYGGKKNQGI